MEAFIFKRLKRSLVPVAFAACVSCAPCLAQTNADSFYNASGSNFFAGDFHAAISNLTRSVELDPRRADAFYARGLCKHELGDYTGATTDYDRAIQLNSKAGGYYCGRGSAKYALKDWRGALADYNKAIELDPTNSVAYFNRGTLRACAHTNLTGAIADFDKALELHTDPREDDIFFSRGNAKEDLKDLVRAIADYNKALQINPNYALARTNLALATDALRASR